MARLGRAEKIIIGSLLVFIESVNPNVFLTSRYYNPNYGYKQYWPGGDWKYLGKTLVPTTPSREPTTPSPPPTEPVQVCGDDCPEMYRNMTEVCVVPSDADKMKYMEQYETMSYCDFLVKSNPRCTYSEWWGIKYVFVHVGPCLQNYVYSYRTPVPLPYNDIYDKTHPDWFTPDVFEMGPKKRITKFVNKFYDSKEWTKFYPGKPYKDVSPFQNFP